MKPIFAGFLAVLSLAGCATATAPTGADVQSACSGGSIEACQQIGLAAYRQRFPAN